jgi:transketolase
MQFPLDLGAFRPLALDPKRAALSADERATLTANIALCRDAIICMTAIADAKGLGGHTGGPFDIVPEVLIADGFVRGGAPVVPIYFDEAGHRVAIQYLMSVLNGHMPAERLSLYREAGAKLPGHPERNFTPGVNFASGRLGHLWAYCNGVAMANPGKAVFLFGSDGAQQEGNDAEAARMAVAHGLEIKLVLDDNDVTIAGHPSQYMPGFDLARTLGGHGLPVDIGDGEALDALYARMAKALNTKGPVALINKRKMAPGVPGIEGSPKGHDVIKASSGAEYLKARGHDKAAEVIGGLKAYKRPTEYRGAGKDWGKNREEFGHAVVKVLSKLTPEQRAATVRVFDSDLEGSCGLTHIKKACPEVYVAGGIMERANFTAAAGFGADPGRQGIMATFSAFMEMIISEITMARLNDVNVLCHFSHAGVDDMADNTCHFGLNNFYADGGVGEHDHTRLYFPADQHQMRAVVAKVFNDPGLRFVFSTRSPVPDILKADGSLFYGEGYEFVPGKAEVIREGSAGYVVSYGEMLFRSLDAVETLRAEGLDVGLVNFPTLNVVDETALKLVGKSPFVLVVETQNQKTGLGSRFGSWLLSRGLAPRYAHLGSTKLGEGGLWEQITHQGLDPKHIMAAVKALKAR